MKLFSRFDYMFTKATIDNLLQCYRCFVKMLIYIVPNTGIHNYIHAVTEIAVLMQK